MTLHSSSQPRACKDSKAKKKKKNNTDSNRNKNKPSVHTHTHTHTNSCSLTQMLTGTYTHALTHAFTGRVNEHCKVKKNTQRKTSGQNHLGKKKRKRNHPILSGVEISHKHIPDLILTSSQAISILVNTVAYPHLCHYDVFRKSL